MSHILQISFYKQAKNYLLLIHSLAWWISPIFIMESRIHSLRNLCGNVLAGTFVLMKGDFGVSKCNTSNPNTRYYPFSLWCDLNSGGVWLSHGQSQIRAWYPQGGGKQKNTTDDRNVRFRYRGETRLSPDRGNSPLITAREKTRTEIYRWHRYFSCTCIGLDDLWHIADLCL